MKERPILFSGEMVRAIFEGRKTQTRRVVKRHGSTVDGYSGCGEKYWASLDFDRAEPRLQSTLMVAIVGKANAPADTHLRVPRSEDSTHHRVRSQIQIGDQLFVREQTWKHRETAQYRHANNGNDASWREAGWKKVPGIHMPRSMLRLTLEVTGVRVERLQEISEADCAAEGITTVFRGMPVGGLRWEYAALWDRINGAGSWDANPWVWVIEFKRVEARS